jgi:hypothetical protein
MIAFIYGCFALSLVIFGSCLAGLIHCNRMGIDPDDFMPDQINLIWITKLSGCVTIVWLAAIYALHMVHFTVQSLGQ